MSRIRSRDTKPELALRKALHRAGLRYSLGGAGLPGRPDIVLRRHKTVIFVHGCFWHNHADCRDGKIPASNTEYWEEKFSRNVARDRRVVEDLTAAGWKIIIAWECDLRGKAKLEAAAKLIVQDIIGTRSAIAP
jgi:DNA mismatch endonuclease (patch repair protein)